MRPRVPLIAACCLAALAGGCGSSADERDPFGPVTTGASAAGGGSAAADERAAAVAQRLRAAGRAKGCRGVRALLHPAYGEVSDESCGATKDLLEGMRSARAAAYGSAVVVDFRARGGARRAAVLVPGKGGLKLAFVEDVPQATVGTGFAPDFDDAAKQVLELAETGDCRALASVAHRSIGPAIDEQRACDALPDSPFVKALEAEPELKPRRLGGSSFYAFYALRPKDGPRFTLILAQQDPAEVAPAAGPSATGASGPSGPGLSGSTVTAARFAFVDALPTS